MTKIFICTLAVKTTKVFFLERNQCKFAKKGNIFQKKGIFAIFFPTFASKQGTISNKTHCTILDIIKVCCFHFLKFLWHHPYPDPFCLKDVLWKTAKFWHETVFAPGGSKSGSWKNIFPEMCSLGPGDVFPYP